DLAAADGLHLHGGAEDGLAERDRDGAEDVEPVAREEPVGLDLEGDQQVALRPAGGPVTPLPLEPHAGAGLGRGRHRHQQLLAGPLLAAATARGARRRRDAATPAARRAWPVDREPALP